MAVSQLKGPGYQRVLASVAFLRAQMNSAGGDYFTLIIPMLREALAKVRPDRVTDAGCSDLYKIVFGLSVPPAVCRTLIGRLIKEGSLKQEGNFVFLSDALAPTALENDIKVREEQTDELLSALRDFALSHYDLSWTHEDAARILTAYINQFSVDYLSYFVKSSGLPDAEATDAEAIVVSAFTNHLREAGPALFEILSSTVKGTVLANALLCEDLGNLSSKLTGLTAYLDTPLLLRLLGFNSRDQELEVVELVRMMKELGLNVRAFPHSIDELKSSFGRAITDFGSYRRITEVLRWTYRHGKSKADLVETREKLEATLRLKGVSLSREVEPSSFAKEEEEGLRRAINDRMHYWSERTLDYDIRSALAAITLRHGESPGRIEEAKHVFITSNSTLVDVVNGRVSSFRYADRVGLFLSDMTIGNILWLRIPLASEFPALKLAALCSSALELGEEELQNVVEEAIRLQEKGGISSEELQLFRSGALDTDMAFVMAGRTTAKPEDLEAAVARYRSSIEQPLHYEITKASEERDRMAERIERQSSQLASVASLIAGIAGWSVFVVVALLLGFGVALLVLRELGAATTGWGLVGTIGLVVINYVARLLKWPTALDLKDKTYAYVFQRAFAFIKARVGVPE